LQSPIPHACDLVYLTEWAGRPPARSCHRRTVPDARRACVRPGAVPAAAAAGLAQHLAGELAALVDGTAAAAGSGCPGAEPASPLRGGRAARRAGGLRPAEHLPAALRLALALGAQGEAQVGATGLVPDVPQAMAWSPYMVHGRPA